MRKLRNDRGIRGIYMGYINDGIIDIFIGMVLLLAGLMLFTDMFWMTGAYAAILLPVVWSAKEKITMPRLRVEEIGSDARKNNVWIVGALIVGLLMTVLAVVFVFLIFGRSGLITVSREAVSLVMSSLIGVTVLGGFIVVGVLYDARRWFVYTFAVAVFEAAAWLLEIGLPWVLVATGVTMGMGGIVCLVRFLESHPIKHEGDTPAL